MNISSIQQSYSALQHILPLGVPSINDTIDKNTTIGFPLSTLNRHGLIAGATGTGKTKTLQHVLEMLSKEGVPTLAMDIKGDLSGIAAIGTTNEKIVERANITGQQWNPTNYPVEFLSLGTKEGGVPLRATVTEFGPLLFAKILNLNETQTSVLTIIFKYSDDLGLPLVDLEDLKSLLRYIQSDGEEHFQAQYGTVSSATTGIILRSIVELEQQGAQILFGERSFDVEDLLTPGVGGLGTIHMFRLFELQDRPKLFSTFMLQLLSELFQKFPEAGDMQKPKLMICIDEAHLIFKEASPALLSQLETVIKLIRSKGVGIIFITQSPDDIPESILAQLGFKIQHALRAFTAKDRQSITLMAKNFPVTDQYDVEELLTSLPIGEALVTGIGEKGEPLPLVHTIMFAPETRMDILSPEEFQTVVEQSTLMPKYKDILDTESAYELLLRKMENATESTGTGETTLTSTNEPSSTGAEGVGNMIIDLFNNPIAKSLLKSVATSLVRNVTGQVTRGVMGGLMGKRK